jgi:O-antigen/teichoic acid export membrane protein
LIALRNLVNEPFQTHTISDNSAAYNEGSRKLQLSIVQWVQQGYQEGFIDSAWSVAGKLASLAGLLVVVKLKGGLLWLVLAVAGLPVIFNGIDSIVLFVFRKPSLQPRLRDFRWRHARRILDAGPLFFIIQAAFAIAFSTDNLILAHYLGPNAVAEYSGVIWGSVIAQAVIVLIP